METIKIQSDEHWHSLRAEDLTSTDMAALFDMSPYLTEFELWHRKKEGIIPEFEATERMKWGNRLEASIAEGIAEEYNLKVVPMKDYYKMDGLRIGTSCDFSILESPDFEGEGILEIKNVDGMVFARDWRTDQEGTAVEAPPHIELQVQHQLLVTGRDYAYIGALVGGNTLHVIKRKSDDVIGMTILKRAANFWQSIAENNPPEINYEKDSEFLISMYNHAEPGKEMESDEKIEWLAEQYRDAASEVKDAEKKKAAAKAQLLELVGESEKVRGPNFTISCGVTGPKEIPAYTRKGFRNFRISWRKS